VALPKIGFNEGSLLRRTLLHVGTFLVGSAAFIGIVSFVLVTIAKGIVGPREAAAEEEPETAAPVTTTAAAAPKAARPHAPKTNRGKRGAAPAVATATPAKDE
jgi:hypothetical protein